MKFKIIFLSFNILIIFSFLIIFLLPVFMLGTGYASQFWQESWYIALLFAVVIGIINVVYFINRKILGYLENENWYELKVLLEDYIFNKKKYSKMYIRMYISTCIATSSISDLSRLEAELRTEKPEAVRTWALQLGLPYLLENDPGKMKNYFGEFRSAGTPDSGWLTWNYCFALLLQKETGEAVDLLIRLFSGYKDPILKLSSLYMLSPFRGDEAVEQVINDGRAGLRRKMTKEGFRKEVENQRDNVQMLFLSKIFSEAVDWLFTEQGKDTE